MYSYASLAGEIISYLGDCIDDSVYADVLPKLMTRLKNEITRTSTLRALTSICNSSLVIDLSPIFEEAIIELSNLLRQQSRSLLHDVLETLIAMVCKLASYDYDLLICFIGFTLNFSTTSTWWLDILYYVYDLNYTKHFTKSYIIVTTIIVIIR